MPQFGESATHVKVFANKTFACTRSQKTWGLIILRGKSFVSIYFKHELLTHQIVALWRGKNPANPGSGHP
jgi:hypothetical protein